MMASDNINNQRDTDGPVPGVATPGAAVPDAPGQPAPGQPVPPSEPGPPVSPTPVEPIVPVEPNPVSPIPPAPEPPSPTVPPFEPGPPMPLAPPGQPSTPDPTGVYNRAGTAPLNLAKPDADTVATPPVAPAAAYSYPYVPLPGNETPYPAAATAPPGYGFAQPASPPPGLSLTSMILGIVSVVASFVLLGFLPGVAAVITGHIAQRRQPEARGYWLTGLITGYIGVGVGVLTALVVIVPLVIFWIAYSSSETGGIPA